MKKYCLLTILLILIFPFSRVFADRSDAYVYPFYEVQDASKDGQIINKMSIINSGLVGLQMRLDLIRSAQESINIEYFIYNNDNAGKIFSMELAKAAKRGVTVRVLIDKSFAVFVLDEHFAKSFKENGIELRYYNNRKGISSLQFRSHRKLLEIDGKVAITGGRNIGDDYFDLSTHFNFLDRDIYVKAMKDSFFTYWNHKLTELPVIPKMPQAPTSAYKIDKIKKFKEKMKVARSHFIDTAELMQMKSNIERIARPLIDNLQVEDCPITTYAADKPGARFSQRVEKEFTDNYRVFRKVLNDKILKVENEIIISSPYFINNHKTKGLMDKLVKKKVSSRIYTNSLASTDAVYVAANFYKKVFKWIKSGIEVFVHDGKAILETEFISDEVRDSVWGTHSKTHVYDQDEFMIGTYNVDNRSSFYNSEMGLFCKGSTALTKNVRDNILLRSNNGVKILKRRKAIDRNGDEMSVYGITSTKSKFLMKFITLPSWMLKFLL